MKKMTSNLFKTAAILALGALATVATPQTASADPVTFQVNEGTVPGANNITFDANKITGDYIEYVFLTPTSPGQFNFTTIAVATFQGYTCVGCPAPNPNNQVGPSFDNGQVDNDYGLYAIFSATGTFNGTTFSPNDATFDLYIDPLQNSDRTFNDAAGTITVDTTTNDDYKVLNSTSIFGGGGTIGTPKGNFFLFFNDLLLTPTAACPPGAPVNTNQCGGIFYFTFPVGLNLIADVNGDFDQNFSNLSLTTFRVTGDLSAVFQDATVPEPATLTLFGLGMIAAGVRARRKGKKVE